MRTRDISSDELDGRIFLAMLKDAPESHSHEIPPEDQVRIMRRLPPGTTLTEIANRVLLGLEADGMIDRPARCGENCKKFPVCAHLQPRWAKAVERRLIREKDSLLARGLVRAVKGGTFRKDGVRMPRESRYFTIFEAHSHHSFSVDPGLALKLVKLFLNSEVLYSAFLRKECFLPITKALIDGFLRRQNALPGQEKVSAHHLVDAEGVHRAGGFVIEKLDIEEFDGYRSAEVRLQAKGWGFRGSGFASDRIGDNGISEKRVIGEAIAGAIRSCYYSAIIVMAPRPSGLRLIVDLLERQTQNSSLLDQWELDIAPALPEIAGSAEAVGQFKRLRQAASLFWILGMADLLRMEMLGGLQALFASSPPSHLGPRSQRGHR